MSTEKSTDVWIRTTPDGAGGYVVTIEVGNDVARTLDEQEVMRHAAAVMRAVAYAEYDAAVAAQLRKVGKGQLTDPHLAAVLRDLRAKRPPLDAADTAPLALNPIVSAYDGQPRITVSLAGKYVGEWDLQMAEKHVLAVLGAVAAAQLDGDYRAALITDLGTSEAIAENIVDDLGSFRQMVR